MLKDTLTIELNGDVSLNDFTETIVSFKSLIDLLSKEVSENPKIDWVIDDLNAGSATATVRGFSDTPDDVEKVVKAYGIIGTSMEKQSPIPYSDEINRKAFAITKVINGRITSIRFETAFGDSTIAYPIAGNIRKTGVIYSFGTVKGTVQTLTKRRGLRFTLYDPIFDRAISCYLKEDQEEIMRNAWGKKVYASGIIGRYSETGYPVTIRDIKDISIIKKTEPGSFRLARAILPMKEKSEDIIRRFRDA